VGRVPSDQQWYRRERRARDKLRRFILSRWEAGANETELLAVEGLKYLKKLDRSPTG